MLDAIAEPCHWNLLMEGCSRLILGVSPRLVVGIFLMEMILFNAWCHCWALSGIYWWRDVHA